MKKMQGFKRYKSLFDDCLAKDLDAKNGLNTWQIQVRQCDSLTHFSIYYTDGYKLGIKVRFAQGYTELKRVITELEDIHNG